MRYREAVAGRKPKKRKKNPNRGRRHMTEEEANRFRVAFFAAEPDGVLSGAELDTALQEILRGA